MWKLVTAALRRRPARWPEGPAPGPGHRGRVEIDWARCTLEGACAPACPTGAIRLEHDPAGRRATLTLDHGHCVFCGLCEQACAPGAVRLTSFFEMAATHREDLVARASWGGGSGAPGGAPEAMPVPAPPPRPGPIRVLVVDAGDCGGCLDEVGAAAGPDHDLARFAAELVQDPAHAEVLLVTGPVTRPLEASLRAAWLAMPRPARLVALGACAIGGGIFHDAYGQRGGLPGFLPVDLWVPGCPPRPQAILHALAVAAGRVAASQHPESWSGPYPERAGAAPSAD